MTVISLLRGKKSDIICVLIIPTLAAEYTQTRITVLLQTAIRVLLLQLFQIENSALKSWIADPSVILFLEFAAYLGKL